MKKESGFTLVELMVVVSITVLLLSWGVPSYSTWNKKHRIENQMVQLYSDLQFGRMSAYSSKVVSGVWWGGGASFTSYQIRSDTNGNGYIDDDGGPPNPVSAVTAAPNVVVAVTTVPPGNQSSVSFDGRGFLNIVSSQDPANSVTFYVAPSFGAGMDCVAVWSTE